MKYEGYFYPLSYRELFLDVTLNITEIKVFENGVLYTLQLEQLDVTDPFDLIAMGRENLGYFYVTEDTIYIRRMKEFEGLTDEMVRLLAEDEEEFLQYCDIVCTENGTVDVVDENGWHSYVSVDGDKRIYSLYNNYRFGTKQYEKIIWERGKGIVHYVCGAGSMLMHVEFGVDMDEPLGGLLDWP